MNRWAVFAVGIVAQVVFSATFLGLPTASLPFQDILELSTGEVALVLGAASIAVVLTELPWGVAADRLGERAVLLIGILGAMAALAALVIVTSTPRPSIWVLCGMLFLAAGMGGAVTGPSGSAILGWFPARRHGTLLSLRVAAVPAGGAAGTLTYSWLLSRWGAPATFAVFAVACSVCAVLVWLFVFDPSERTAKRTQVGSKPPRHILRQADVLRVAASGLFLDISQFFVLTFAAALLADMHGYPPLAGVAAVAVMQLVGGALRVTVGIGSDFVRWMSRTAIVRTLAILQTVCLAVVVAGGRLPLALTMVAILTAGIASCAWQGAHFAQIADFAGPSQSGAALGLNNAATSLGAFIPQLSGGVLVLSLGWSGATLVLGMIPAALAVLLFPRARSGRRAGTGDRTANLPDAA